MGLLKRSSVGMEIDSKEIRIVHAEGSADKPVPCTFARYPLPDGIVRDGRVVNPAELGAAISAFWAKEGIKSRDVILGINNQDVIIRFAVVPTLPKDKLHNLIHYQSTDYIPIPINEIELDYSVIGETSNNAGNATKLLLVAGRKNMLYDFIEALEAAKLNIVDITVSMLAVVRLLPDEARMKPLVLINLANDFGNIVIMNGNEPGMARTFSYPAVLQPFLTSLEDTGKYDGYTEFSEALEKVGSYLAGEIRSSVQYYRNQEPELVINKIYVSGSYAKIEGLVTEIQQLLQTETIALDLNTAQKAKLTDGQPSSDYTVCFSLALRGLEV